MLASYLSTQIGPTATESGGQPVWAASATEAIATQPVVINQGSARMGPSSQQRQCHGGLVPRAECRVFRAPPVLHARKALQPCRVRPGQEGTDTTWRRVQLRGVVLRQPARG